MRNALACLLLLPPATLAAQDDDAFQRRYTPEVRVVEGAAPTVVYVETNVVTTRWSLFGLVEEEGKSSGSGVVIHEDGYIVTNFHVVKGARSVSCRFDPQFDDQVYEAKLLSWVEEEDLALLKIDPVDDTPFPVVPMGTSSDLMVAEPVMAIGNPYGQTFTVSRGIISGLHRDIEASGLRFQNLIQTDASINPGNSGGPLLNINGELIGINTAWNTRAENIGFAIPVDRVHQVLQDQLLSSSQWQAWLGFDVDEADFSVTRVVEGSPAFRAGIRAGDELMEIASNPIRTVDDFRFARLSVLPGRTTEFRFRRDGSESGDVLLDMVGWDRANGVLYERLGMTLEPVTYGRRRPLRMTRVTGVRPGGPASRLGVQLDDVIEAVRPEDGRATLVSSPGDLAFVVVAMQAGDALAVDLWRDENGDGNLTRSTELSELYKGSLVVE